MKIKNKENDQFQININLDRPRYKDFFKKVTKLAKELEYKSKTKKMDYSVIINAVKIPNMPTGGWSNRTEDFKFVIFLDFDNSLFWQVKTQLEFLMERFDLSPFYVFETESKIDCNGEEYGNYNCVCLTKKKFKEVFDIQEETTCDQMHKHIAKIYRFKSHILRNKPKGSKGAPIFKCIVGDVDKSYKQPISSAHLDFLHKMYDNVPKIKYLSPDGFKTLWLSDYKTAST